MFARTSPTPLKLEIDGQSLTFPTLADFEFALASRTEIPTAKITRLVKLSDQALKEEARAIGEVEKHFVDLLAGHLQDQAALGRDMESLDTKLFSQDHHWRSIMSGLRELTSAHDDYKKAAIVKYTQYLAARQEIVRSIADERQQRALAATFPEKAVPASTAHLSRDTAVFDAAAGPGAPLPDEGFVRLPKGEAVSIRLSAAVQEIPLSLAGHHFRLVDGDPSRLVGENGDQHILQQGKNLIGRELGNHIVVDGSYRDISRKHLLIDLTDPHTVNLTDLSAHGTFIPADALSKS